MEETFEHYMRFYSHSCLLFFGGIIAKLYRKLQQLAQNIIVVEMEWVGRIKDHSTVKL